MADLTLLVAGFIQLVMRMMYKLYCPGYVLATNHLHKIWQPELVTRLTVIGATQFSKNNGKHIYSRYRNNCITTVNRNDRNGPLTVV